MSFEQKWYNEQIEQTKPSINEIKKNISEKLIKLWKIAQNNEQLNLIKEKILLFKNNNEALAVINNWLNKINNSVEDIANNWKQKIRNINKRMIASLEEFERQEELDEVSNLV